MQADASGTVEAVKAALGALPQDSVLLRFLLAAANNITTSDIDLAAASGALVVGFNAEPSEEVAAAAKERGACRRPLGWQLCQLPVADQRTCCGVWPD